MSDETKSIVIDAVDFAIVRLAELGRALRDTVEHGFEVRWRAGNHSEDLARGRLLFQRLRHLCVSFGQRMVLLLKLLEQPRVATRDRRLVGEGFQEIDVGFGKWSGNVTRDDDDADWCIASHHRHGQLAARRQRTLLRQILQYDLGWLCDSVRDMNDAALDNGTTVVRGRIDGSWISGCRCVAEAIVADGHELT